MSMMEVIQKEWADLETFKEVDMIEANQITESRIVTQSHP